MLYCTCTKCLGEKHGDPFQPCENAMMEAEIQFKKSQMNKGTSMILLFLAAFLFLLAISVFVES